MSNQSLTAGPGADISLYNNLGGTVSGTTLLNWWIDEEDSRGQEVSIILSSNLAGEVASSKLILIALWSLCGKFVGLLLEELKGVCLIDSLPFSGGNVVLGPLPELASANFSGSSILLWLIGLAMVIMYGLW